MCGVKSGRSRAFPVMERREMHVISGLRANLGEQRAVDPVYNRSVHFAGSPEHPAVVVKLRDENILHLEISSRMKQRHGIDETFQRSRAEMEPLIHDPFSNKLLEQAGLDSGRKRSVQDALDRD